MRKLAISNSNVSEICTFKVVLLDPLTGNSDNQVPDHEKYTKLTLPKAFVTIRLKNVEKKKAKGQAITKRLSLEENSMTKTSRNRAVQRLHLL